MKILFTREILKQCNNYFKSHLTFIDILVPKKCSAIYELFKHVESEFNCKIVTHANIICTSGDYIEFNSEEDLTRFLLVFG